MIFVIRQPNLLAIIQPYVSLDADKKNGFNAVDSLSTRGGFA